MCYGESRPEFEYIDWLQRQVTLTPAVAVGMGDDAAVIKCSSSACVLSTDMLMEGVDFLTDATDPRLIGRKALAVNLSDLAAMAAVPTACLASWAFPKSKGPEFARQVTLGFLELCAEFDCPLVGGDTNTWNQGLAVSVTVVGVPPTTPILRSGAQVGDILIVTGKLGGSSLGRHLTFTPRVREAQRLVDLCTPHAMIDLSDGLAADLHHVLQASGVGARLYRDMIPIHPDAYRLSDGTPLKHALGDGEDFELLLALSPSEWKALQRVWDLSTPLTCIGEIQAESGCWLQDEHGEWQPLPATGWTHSWT